MTIEERSRLNALVDDCKTCAKLIVVLVWDYGYPQWGAQNEAHKRHEGGHKNDA